MTVIDAQLIDEVAGHGLRSLTGVTLAAAFLLAILAAWVARAEDIRQAHAHRLAVSERRLHALTNAWRHSGAVTVRVTLEAVAAVGKRRLRVQDDGAGFDPMTFTDAGDVRLGLLGMGERAKLIEARFELRSAPFAWCESCAQTCWSWTTSPPTCHSASCRPCVVRARPGWDPRPCPPANWSSCVASGQA